MHGISPCSDARSQTSSQYVAVQATLDQTFSYLYYHDMYIGNIVLMVRLHHIPLLSFPHKSFQYKTVPLTLPSLCSPLALPLLSPCPPPALPLPSPGSSLALPLIFPCPPLALPLPSPCSSLAIPLPSPSSSLALPWPFPCPPLALPLPSP